jgi:transcriptional regulator with XRE-family HTH domain
MTRLDTYIQEWGVKPGVFARKAGVSRQHLLRLRNGTMDPSRAVMCKLALAASAMRNERVFITDMFELTKSEELAHNLLVVAKFMLTTTPPTTKVAS